MEKITVSTSGKKKPERLYSLDALRGFDMLWISGGEKLIVALSALTGWPFFKWAAHHMEHAQWNGFAFYDMIFPLFLFIAGVSLPLSLAKRLSKGESKRIIYKHLFKRLIALIILGILYNGLLRDGFDNPRFASVLGRIGLAWFFAAIIVLHTSKRFQVIWFFALLFIYWAAMMLIPVPGHGAGILTPEGNLAAHIDRMIVPGRLYLGVHDPEGIFATIPAISTALLGVMVSYFIKWENKKLNGLIKTVIMIASGLLLVALGNLWGQVFPVNKNLWTSSFVLVAGGWSILLLAVFYLVTDVWKWRKWAFPFTVIGLNSITVYMIQAGIINFNSMRNFFFGSFIELLSDNWAAVISAIGYILCVWTFLYLLYRKNIFLKV